MNRSVFIMIIFWASLGILHAQDQIGGPYTADEHTVLLMHFDGNLINESDNSADGVEHGTLYYIPNNLPGLGQCLRIDNSSITDSSRVTVADTAALDLDGDWTIEGWINIFTFGEGGEDWRWVPRLVMKPGDETFWLPNYFLEMWGSTRAFELGYNAGGQNIWPKVVSPNNTFRPGKWFHLSFSRDITRKVLIQITHNENLEIVSFSSASLDPYLDPSGAIYPWDQIKDPTITNTPLNIGYGGGGGDSWLDGFVDEIRISTVVREFPIPPVIINVTRLENQGIESTEYPVEAEIYSFFETPITSRSLFYDAGSGWNEVEMTATGETDMYSAAIPQQTVDTKVKYYVQAIDSEDLENTVPQKALETETFLEFSIIHIQENVQTLGLTFEEGSGVTTDAGVHNHTVTMVGNPVYSGDAVDGSYSIELEGDSSYLEVESPYLSSKEYTIDLWFNADSMHYRSRLINRPVAADNGSDNCYQIRFERNNKIYAGTFVPSSGRYFAKILDDSLHLNNWYHVIYEVQAAPEGDSNDYYGILQLRDESDNFLSQKYFMFDSSVVQALAPLRIGYAAGTAHYEGKLDNINIYNYPHAQLIPKDSTTTAIDNESDIKIPGRYSLSQNYPNPFNPSTEIIFSIAKHEKVSLTVYDVLGRKVITLVDDDLFPDEHKIVWNGKDDSGKSVASGIYMYQLTTDNYSKVRKMILMK